ncbi:MAG TPA: hypothetical protein VFG09_10060 [Thermodesulfovibrionales bacterium]|jgi:hypothetical protein|nr:hypothetical protein [Thermodesulfovibrionales bacterium]
MDTAEKALWKDIVSRHVAETPEVGLTKAKQQALALALQQWTAVCITKHLEDIIGNQTEELLKHVKKDKWHIHHQGKTFLGAIRWQEVDVWMTNDEAGLVLAVDPKHFQSKDSLNKNWKNGHNDLTAFATNLHERFPMCVIGGVISFPEWAAAAATLKQMSSICSRSIPRERPLNAYGKFEGFGLAVYDRKYNLVWPPTLADSLRPTNAFKSLANAIFTRTMALL